MSLMHQERQLHTNCICIDLFQKYRIFMLQDYLDRVAEELEGGRLMFALLNHTNSSELFIIYTFSQFLQTKCIVFEMIHHHFRT